MTPAWPSEASPSEAAAAATLRSVLEQLVMLDVAEVRIEPRGPAGSLARVMAVDRLHEVVCELNAAGDLLSARVIEL